MADLSQRPLIPIGVDPRATEQPPDAGRRSLGDDAVAAVPTDMDGERGPDSASVTGVPPRETAVPPDDASLESAIEALARDAALLREAVARFDITGRPADAVPPDDAPLLDTLVAAQAREQRARDDTVELTRGLARITTHSALLLVKFTDSAAAFLGRHAAPSEAPATAPVERRPFSPWIAAGAALAGIAAIVSVLALLQARENAREVERLQQALVQSIRDNAQAQETAVRSLEAGMRELTSREAALVEAIQAATPAPPHPAEPEAAPRREPAKPAAPSRNAKRKATR
jgi:hypothetical protein